ncbi:hypothetical protein RB601_003821 [Gaeumannomyces tritici]
MESAPSDLLTALPAEEAPTPSPVPTPPQPDLPFLSHEPKLGDPSQARESFDHAKLRKFPKPYSSIRIIGDLSDGADVCIKYGQMDDGKEVVIKIFDHNEHNSTNYWTFERECRISAKLESIYAMYRRATAGGCPLFIRPSPEYRRAAMPNLEAISDEFADKYCRRASSESFTPAVVDIPECYGWVQLNEAIPSMYPHPSAGYESTAPRWEKPFAIIYELVPGSTRPNDVVLPVEELFYLLDLGPEVLV